MKSSGSISEEYLFEIFDIIKDYVPSKDREVMAEHIYDYLNGIGAPSSIFEGLSECDDIFNDIYSKNATEESEYDDYEEFDDTDEED